MDGNWTKSSQNGEHDKSISRNRSWLSNKLSNKRVQSINGNGKNALISHWNMGSRMWHSKRLEIRHFIVERNPDIHHH